MDGGRLESRVRCVLWHEPGVPVPESLLSALARRGIGFVARTTANRALAEACALSLEGPADRCVLLMVEPSRLPGSDEVRAIVPKAGHRASVWVYEASAPVQLRAAAPASRAEAEPPPSAGRRGPHTLSPEAPRSPAAPPAPAQVVVVDGLHAKLGLPDRAPDAARGVSDNPTDEGLRPVSPDRATNGHAPNVDTRSGSPSAPDDEAGLLSREELDILLGRGAEG
ncbi:MAG: hypothetical protein IT439_01375 [Phycisphaerales bacterium]|nr:hypothetical protein [Phycisphaerales bacterium]